MGWVQATGGAHVTGNAVGGVAGTVVAAPLPVPTAATARQAASATSSGIRAPLTPALLLPAPLVAQAGQEGPAAPLPVPTAALAAPAPWARTAAIPPVWAAPAATARTVAPLPAPPPTAPPATPASAPSAPPATTASQRRTTGNQYRNCGPGQHRGHSCFDAARRRPSPSIISSSRVPRYTTARLARQATSTRIATCLTSRSVNVSDINGLGYC